MTKTCRSEAGVPAARVAEWLDGELRTRAFADVSNNGLQIEARPGGTVRKAAFGVDASVRFFRAAAARGADFAVCHHGVSWGGGVRAVAGSEGAAIRAALAGGISLYAAHLPLDASEKHGNNYGMARALGLADLRPAYPYHGAEIGCAGELPEEMRPAEFLELVRRVVSPSAEYRPAPAPDARIRTVGVCSGGGGFAAADAAAGGHDVLLTGEASLGDYTAAENLGQAVVCAGHYRTEKWGVRALAAAMADALGIETEFVDFDLPF